MTESSMYGTVVVGITVLGRTVLASSVLVGGVVSDHAKFLTYGSCETKDDRTGRLRDDGTE